MQRKDSKKQQQIKDIMKKSQDIFLSYALAKVPDENPVIFDTNGFYYSGTKTIAESMSNSVQLKTGAIQLQPQIIPGSKSQEVVQVAMLNYKNPYGWGYKSGLPITTGVLDFSLHGVRKRG
jgi:hypothetical protein